MEIANGIPSAYLNRITLGDSRLLAQQIPDNSIDLIFTDPPYLRQYLPLYAWLAQEAARVLKPGGFLLTYVGGMWKYHNMQQLGQYLTYFHDYITLYRGSCTVIWPRKTISRYKSILAFVKGEGLPRYMVLSSWNGSGQDKRYHIWGQDESTARYYIDCFSAPGDLVWDPFCGGGTVPYVCTLLNRECIAFEIDPEAAQRAQTRLETVQSMLPQAADTLLASIDAPRAGTSNTRHSEYISSS